MIGIRIQDENGRTLSQFDDAHIIHDLLSVASPDTKCLRFIDPYADTIFNSLQCPILANEIIVASSALPDEQFREAATALAQFVATCDVHQYVKFIGD